MREARLLLRYAAGLREYLAKPLGLEESRRVVAGRIVGREASFLEVLRRGIYAIPGSPWRRLLDHAGVELADVERLVHEEGLEGALERLFDAGVYVTLDEFNGRRPVRRGSLSLDAAASDFDNPLGAKHYATHTGGSSGPARPVLIDFGMTEHEARYLALLLHAFEVDDRPFAVWFPLPPGVAGTKAVLVRAKLGRAAEHWFTTTRLRPRPSSLHSAALTTVTVLGARAAGVRLAWPEHTPPEDAWHVARWLAGRRAAGTPALISATPSSGVRVCQAAGERGLDVSGTIWWFGGEPYTSGKAKVVEAAGCRAASNYYFTEIGQLGIACAAPREPGEVHFAVDTAAAIERPARLAGGATVDALYLTSLLEVSPKLALNVESGDHGVLERRSCGCPLEAVGYDVHLRTIRSYEKLTTEGMNFLGDELIRIVEELLPARFGGGATDYQFVEEERDGLTRVRLLVSPRVGAVDERAAMDAVLEALAAGGRPQRMMAAVWRSAGTLEVVRAEPYVTTGSKILPLHFARPDRATEAAPARAGSLP